MEVKKNGVLLYGTLEQEDKLKDEINKYKEIPGGLIPLLQKVQDIYGYLPLEVQKKIAEGLKIPLARVSGVQSFYAFFTEQKCGKYVIRCCTSAPCHLNNANKTLQAFEETLGITVGETTLDGRYTLETIGCLGICDRAPAVMINDNIFGPVYPEDIETVLESLCKEGI